MSYGEARELARIRQELREKLMTQRCEGAQDALARLQLAAEGDAELRGEYERWRLRFQLLGSPALL
jgi:hypothetical protein